MVVVTTVLVEVVVCDTVVVVVVRGIAVGKANEVFVVVGVVISQEHASLINEVGIVDKSVFSGDKESGYKMGDQHL
jgi:hypothetical protein